jgi:hypothetical protein
MFTTQYVLYTTPIGTKIYTATANNDETLQTLTYSYVSETPSGKYFDVDTSTGTSIFRLLAALEPHVFELLQLL